MVLKRGVLTVLCCSLFIAGVAAAAEIEGEPTTAVQQEPCCFENPRYSGTCQATPGPDESCGDILTYLNTPNSVGKGYCGNTPVRGGWSQVPCSGDAAAGTMTCESSPAVD